METLKRLGIDTSTWAETPGGAVQPQMVQGQAATLKKVKAMLEQMLEQDNSKVAELREQLARLKFGGGS